MLSLKVMLVLIIILLSIKDTTIAHTTHDQVVKQKIGVDEAGNDIAKLGKKEVYNVPASIQVIGRGRKEMEEGIKNYKKNFKNSVAAKKGERNNRASLMAFSAADYHMPVTHPPKNN
ncbi:hypothetical protein HAX54_034930 [Datura stramonium]|uniref:Uncharacterized protein n=1 Tax=Datura stramonium TaxID=4076 RepID=A0ABS8VHV0_DATST|nr:hypothetical protein [Datura stramonium]